MVVACLGSAGCWWGQPGGNPGQTFSNYDPYLTVDNVASLQQTWSGRGGMSAVFDGKVVGGYWTGTGVDVVAHDLDTGTEIWSRTLTPPGATWGLPTHPPVITGTSVWAGFAARTASDTCVFGLSRLDLATGSVLGTDSSRAPVELVPFGDDVALTTVTYSPLFDGTCFPGPSPTLGVADGATGATEWTASLLSSHDAAVIGDTLYGTMGSSLRIYPSAGCGAPTCRETSLTTPGVGHTGLAGESTGPLLTVAATGFGQTSLIAIDPAKGTSLGSTVLPFNGSSLALADGRVFVAGETSVAAYEIASCAAGSCAMQWSASLGGDVTWAKGLAVAGGVVYVGRVDGVVEAFDAAGCGAQTCTSLASVTTPDTVLQLAVAQGHLLVGSLDQVTVFAPTA